MAEGRRTSRQANAGISEQSSEFQTDRTASSSMASPTASSKRRCEQSTATSRPFEKPGNGIEWDEDAITRFACRG
jgi:hypothetical protein